MFDATDIHQILGQVQRQARQSPDSGMNAPAHGAREGNGSGSDMMMSLMETLCALLLQLIHQAECQVRVPKKQISSVMGALGRISREVRNWAMHTLTSELKAALRTHGGFRARVLAELGGVDVLWDWEMKRASSFVTPSAMAPQDEARSCAPSVQAQWSAVSEKRERNEDSVVTKDGDERNGKSRIKTAMDGVFRLAPMPRQALAHPTPNDTKGRDETQKPRAPYGSKVLETMFPIHLSPADLMGGTETPSRSFPRKWESGETDQEGDPHLRGDERNYLGGDEAISYSHPHPEACSEHATGSSASSFVTPSAMAPQDEAIDLKHSEVLLNPHPEETRSVVTKDEDVATHITDIFDNFDTRIEAYQIAQIYLNKARSYLRADRAYECPV